MGAPVKYTCPLIDRVISEIKDVISQIREEYPDEAHFLEGIVHSHGSLEEIRDANDSLRSWGYKEEARADNKSDFRFSFFGLLGSVCPQCHTHHFLIDPEQQ